MSNIDMFIWFNTCIAIIGTFLNAKQVRFGFVLWMATNAIFAIYDIYITSYPQAALFTVYFGLALFGWINWGKKAKQEQKVKNTTEA